MITFIYVPDSDVAPNITSFCGLDGYDMYIFENEDIKIRANFGSFDVGMDEIFITIKTDSDLIIPDPYITVESQELDEPRHLLFGVYNRGNYKIINNIKGPVREYMLSVDNRLDVKPNRIKVTLPTFIINDAAVKPSPTDFILESKAKLVGLCQ